MKEGEPITTTPLGEGTEGGLSLATRAQWLVSQRGRRLVRLPIILILIYYLRPWDLYPVLNVLHLSALLSLLTLGWFLLSKNSGRRLVLANQTTKWAIYFTVVIFISVFFSIYKSDSLIGFQKFIISLSLYIAISAGVLSKKNLHVVLGALLLVLDCHALYVSHAFFTGSYITRVEGFVSGDFIGANSLAAFFILSLPLAGYLFVEARNKLGRLFALGSSGVLLLGLLATQSRGGLVGLVALICFAIFLSRSKMKTIILVLVIGCFTLTFIPPDKLERFQIFSVEKEQMDPSSSSRLYAWGKGVEMWGDHPVVGVGIGQFGTAFGTQYRGVEWEEKFAKQFGSNAYLRPHNIFVQVFSETGGLGFIAFMMVLITSVRSAWRTMRRQEEFQLYAKCVVISAVAYFACMFFDHHAFSIPTWTLFALLVVPEIIESRRANIQSLGQGS